MIIPGFIISWLTFPGVIVHEFAHKLFCQWTGTRVIQVCYFRLGNPAGFVIHETPTSPWKHILIGTGPLFVNTLVGAAIGLTATPLKHANGDIPTLVFSLLMWLAVSVAMHSFPSAGDAKSIWAAIWRRREVPVGAKLVGTPLVALMFVGAVASVVWLDLIYGVIVVIALPLVLHLW